MFSRRLLNLLVVVALAAPLAACVGSLRRDDTAALAKTRMIGMSKEDVLACMGPPKKKASEGATDVWSYLSTDGQGNYNGGTAALTSWYKKTDSSHNKKFCTVNVVMKEGVVTRVNYLGPTATNFFNDNDQCGYAVAACVNGAE